MIASACHRCRLAADLCGLRSHVVHTLFTVMPEQLERIRQQVASSATLLVLLSNALLSEPTALVTV